MIHVKELVWDDWNVAHIARHAVTPGEVEEVYQTHGLVLQGSKGRLVFIAPTRAGRLLAIILDPEFDFHANAASVALRLGSAFPASGP